MTNATEKRFVRALKGERFEVPPFWFMRQAGRYLPEYRKTRKSAQNFLDFCYTPDLACAVTLQPLSRYAMDAAILFSDILVIPDALGQKVEFREGEGPVLEPIRSADDLDRLSPDGVMGHLAPVFETVGRLSTDIPESTALIGFAGAPWTVAVYMVEGRGGTECTEARTWAYTDPDGFGRLIDLLVETTGAYLNRQIENGAEAVQVFDSWAGILSEEQFRDWVVAPNRRIVEIVKAVHPDVPIVGFPRKAGPLYKDFVRETGVDGVSLDHTVPLDWAAETLQKQVTLQGNLDNHLLLAGGAAMERGVRTILEKLNRGPFIFNLGHGVLPPTPPENVARVCDILRGDNA